MTRASNPHSRPDGVAGSPAAHSSGAADSQDPIAEELARLVDCDLYDLRVRWRRLFRKTAPEHLPRALLMRIIGYKIQVEAYGDLDRESLRFLDRVAKAYASGSSKPVPPVADTLSLKPGTVLIREHQGALHRAMVVDEGYEWNGTTFSSLSEVARAITGTRWDGPRFFGLRDRKQGLQAEEAA